MIAVSTILIVWLVIASWRKHAWMIAVLGVVVGVTLGGPFAEMIDTMVSGAEQAASTADEVARNSTK